jgi:structural maintenance of chromosome 2
MHIKEIVLDGFKSYATRTVVSGFDAHFNAITGLNGSGKSNILDGICFVLGITQLNQVRVSNLQGLVYKQGQAGVTKASVSITFDNSDSAQSPVGFETHKEITITRQVVIGGRNKYLINGHNAQASQVQNLFHSVQLNVNNPHFLIMQGRITKVLNMKPPEILGLIEEAAGTRMYETKKQAAQRKMEQKQVKVDEIERLLAEEITPKLEKLREQKQSYLKWAANNTELERLRRFCVAWDYSAKNKELDKTAGLLEDLQLSIEEQKELKDEHDVLLKTLTNKRAEHEATRKSEEGGEYKALCEREGKLSKDLVKQNTKLQNHKSAMEQEQEALVLMQQQDGELQESVVGLQEKLASAETLLAAAIESERAAQDAVEAAKRGVQAATSGIAAQDTKGGGTGTLQEQLINANKVSIRYLCTWTCVVKESCVGLSDNKCNCFCLLVTITHKHTVCIR